MIEAALLALELVFVIALLVAVNRASKPEADKNLGVFDFQKIKILAKPPSENNDKSKKKGQRRA